MKKYKNIIIAAALVIISLIVGFVVYGTVNKSEDVKIKEDVFAVETLEPTPSPTQNVEVGQQQEIILPPTQTPAQKIAEEQSEKTQKTPPAEPVQSQEPIASSTQKTAPIQEETQKTEEADIIVTENPENLKENDEITCTLSIRCDTILDNMDKLNTDKAELVPANGIILAETEVVITDGDSVFDVLKRETKNNKIHFEFVYTPMHNSAYIEGIHNLYERDCGDGSGWLYKVNGKVMQVGCSTCEVNDGDKIEWVYTCKMGNDL